MKLQFKHQQFQEDAAKAVVDVFEGQPNLKSKYLMDRGSGNYDHTLTEDEDFTGWGNQKIVAKELPDEKILQNLQGVQLKNQLEPSEQLEGHYNLTIEMETGVGKTYTYIKTMYELNKAYGWSKFIVVVPSIAIREGVYKTFQVTQEHFAGEYGKKVRFFIYNSAQLTEIDRFASDNSICAMIINSQAFNARGKDARRITMKLDEFRSRRPIDIIAKTNPILIIDEPQSVEGKQTKENLKQFTPLMTLRYSATHKKDSIYNMVYRLDAMEAYNKQLVKKIAVKGISETGTSATESYLYLEGINLSKDAPTASLQFDCKGANDVRKVSRIVTEGFNLYDHSGNLEEYKNNFIVSRIDGRDDSVEFLNGIKIYAGDVMGRINEDVLRRIQIRETILSHIQRERELFARGIKVLSLFFIDEVAKYRVYDEAGQPANGSYARMFEAEYKDIVDNLEFRLTEDSYREYLRSIPAEKTHAGYFSIDKKGRMIDPKLNRKETTADDVDAYELIMKKKELLLDRDPKKSPVRFIFSHSALREGWDNPNVFQICTLKQSSSDVRKRQEVGRGLRLCVNQNGDRMDANVLGSDVHNVNVLTVIASESYDSFAKGLQTELADAVTSRPRAVTVELFLGKELTDSKGSRQVIDEVLARTIFHSLAKNDYLDAKTGGLSYKYYADKANNGLKLPPEVQDSAASVMEILKSVYQPPEIINPRLVNVELKVDENKLAMKEFKELWARIKGKTSYEVRFDSGKLVDNAVEALNEKLHVPPVLFKVETGVMEKIDSKEALAEGSSFVKVKSSSTSGSDVHSAASTSLKYDLVGKLAVETKLTRSDVVQILQGIRPDVFNQFKDNPEEFIIRAAALINEKKAKAVVKCTFYKSLEGCCYDENIFSEQTIRGRLEVNAMEVNKHLYNYLVYDSKNEQKFASELDADDNVAVYVKLPHGFYIATPVGRYTPDWAIAIKKKPANIIYFVAETKGSMSEEQQRLIESAKIHCAHKHFEAISKGGVVYEVVNSYDKLRELVAQQPSSPDGAGK